MTRPIEVVQGEDKVIIVQTNNDLSGSTEIEFGIDTPEKILKTLSDVEITNVTTTQFKVALVPADTENVKPGPYKMQARVTLSGKVYNLKFTPDKIKIMDSVFIDSYIANDYS
jgi:hypothetical protein